MFLTPVRNEGLVAPKHTNLTLSVDCLLILGPGVNKEIYSTLTEILFTYSSQAKRKKQQSTQPIISDKTVDGPWGLGQQTFT